MKMLRFLLDNDEYHGPYTSSNMKPPQIVIHDVYRANGLVICPFCLKDYYSHPLDPEIKSGIDGAPFLHVLCNGDRVKL